MGAKINIAIDGGAGVGKSSVSKYLEKELGYKYISTGSMYRAIALYFIENGLDWEKDLNSLNSKNIDLKYNESGEILLNGKNVQSEIRREEISDAASKSSAIKEVRDFATEIQRTIAKEINTIMEGRDIGTVVLPETKNKFFLTASAENKALRRMSEYNDLNIEADYDAVKKEIEERDYRDSNREIARLEPALDAEIIDTDGKTIEQVAEEIISKIK